MEYENRIEISSEQVRSVLEWESLINELSHALDQLESGPLDGSIFIDTIEYENETQELVFWGKGGPAPRVAKYLSEKLPGTTVILRWLSEGFDRGKISFREGEILD